MRSFTKPFNGINGSYTFHDLVSVTNMMIIKWIILTLNLNKPNELRPQLSANLGEKGPLHALEALVHGGPHVIGQPKQEEGVV